MMLMNKKVFLVTLLTLFLSFSVNGLPNNHVGGSVAENDPLLPPLIVLSTSVTSPLSDVITPVLIGPHSPSGGDSPTFSSSNSFFSVGESSLSLSEMRLVMNGGRNYDPYTKKWGYRDAFVGEKRNAFMLSWESHRRKSNVNQLLPFGERYSKE